MSEKMIAWFEQRKESFLFFCMNIAVIVSFWGGMLRPSFCNDTLIHMIRDDADVEVRMGDGRYLIALIDQIFWKGFGIKTTDFISINVLFTMLFLAIALTACQKIFRPFVFKKEENEKNNSFFLLSFVGFVLAIDLMLVNILSLEILVFCEMNAYLALSIMLGIISIRFYADKKYIKMFLMMLAAVCVYQYAAIIAAAVVTFYIAFDEKFELTGKVVVREIIALLLCIVPGLLNMISLKVLTAVGVIPGFRKEAGMGSLSEKFSGIVKSLKGLYAGADIFPPVWVPALFILAVWGILVYSCLQERKWNKLLYLSIIWIGCQLLMFVFPFLSQTFTFPARFAYLFFGIQGLMALTVYVLGKGISRELVAVGVCGYVMIHMLFAHFEVDNHFVSNTLDEVYAHMVVNEIEKYEANSGITVEKLAVKTDTYAPHQYNEVSYATSAINERALDFVPNTLLKTLGGRSFEITEMDKEIYSTYFEGKNWDYMDLSEQLVIVGDTAYWCVF